ncbi:MAG: carbon-nitrogen hydrolase family protein [Neptuniibacter sp.]
MTKVAVAQMLSGENLTTNLDQARTLAEEAAAKGASLLLLPENFAMLDSKALIVLAQEEKQSKVISEFLAQLAARLELWIIAGSVPVLNEEGNKVFASCLVYDSEGHLHSRYNKIHLFDVDVADGHACYRESDFIQHGSELVVADTPVGKIGLSICYDLRFPEHYQKLRIAGCQILIVPSAFTYVTGEAHWEVLLRARAIETQSYVLAANQGGEHSATRKSWGHSMIVDPWGCVIAERSESGPGLVCADVDLKEVERRRTAMPVMQHRSKAGF